MARARSRGSLVLAYRAAVLLRLLTGWGWRKIQKTLKEIGIETTSYNVIHWLYHGKKTYFMPTALEKSLYYHIAYELVLKTAAEHPDWGPKRVATHVSKLLPIRIPALTAYFWITRRSRLNVTPVRPYPALGYLVGVLTGDYTRSKNGKGLHVKDREFAEYYAKMYEEVTGVRPNVHHDTRGHYHTYEHAAWLKELWHSGLWKVVAYVYPLDFLRGLYDSEGTITPHINKANETLDSVRVKLTIGDLAVKEFAKKLLTTLGFRVKERYTPPRPGIVRGEKVVFGEYWELFFESWDELERFAQLIGFREQEKA